MKKNVFLSMSFLAVLALSVCSCTTEEFIKQDKTEENIIELVAPPFPAIGDDAETRTSYDETETNISTKWVVDDVIYIGSPVGLTADQTLESLVASGKFVEFKCTEVDENGKGTFEGNSLPDDATMAIYGDKTILKTNGADGFIFELQQLAYLTGVRETDLSGIDLLCAPFDKETSTIGKFNRGAALLKIEIDCFDGNFKGAFTGFKTGDKNNGTTMIVSCGTPNTHKPLSKSLIINSDCSIQQSTKESDLSDVFFRFFKTVPTVENNKLILYTFVPPTGDMKIDYISVYFRNGDKNTTNKTKTVLKTIDETVISANDAINVKFSAEDIK